MTSSAESANDALDFRVSGVIADIGACVSLLVAPDPLPRFVVAERLVRLGSALIPHLIPILQDPDADEDLRGCAAFLAFSVGDRHESAMALLDQIETDGPWAPGAAMKLGKTRYPGSLAAIEAALQRIDDSSIDTIVSYLQAFQHAGGRLPADLRRRFSASKHWQVATAVSEFFPAVN